MYHHRMSLTEIDNLIPWERQVYLSLIIQEMDRIKEERQNQSQQQNNMSI